jgi:hypothetical protein
MCYHLTVLSHAGAHRRVAQCEHGSIHLTWDIATIHLQADYFLTLVALFERWIASNDTHMSLDGWGQVTRDANGSARLWVGQAGLALMAGDVAVLRSLIGKAAADIQAALTQPADMGHQALRFPILTIDAGELTQN